MKIIIASILCATATTSFANTRFEADVSSGFHTLWVDADEAENLTGIQVGIAGNGYYTLAPNIELFGSLGLNYKYSKNDEFLTSDLGEFGEMKAGLEVSTLLVTSKVGATYRMDKLALTPYLALKLQASGEGTSTIEMMGEKEETSSDVENDLLEGVGFRGTYDLEKFFVGASIEANAINDVNSIFEAGSLEVSGVFGYKF